MTINPQFELHFANCEADIAAAQHLRYHVFVNELGGGGAMVDHAQQRECDAYDAHAHHLILRDHARPPTDNVIGVYRVMDRQQADAAGGFSSANEYDLAPILTSDRPMLELGRSCLHPDYRGGGAMHQLWHGLGRFVQQTGTQVLFGVASFHGTDIAALRRPLRYLHDVHLAPPTLRPTAVGPNAVSMAATNPDPINHKAALLEIPALIKAYLRLGGVVGQGAYVDHAFNTVDVCMVVDVGNMSDRQRRIYGRTPA